MTRANKPALFVALLCTIGLVAWFSLLGIPGCREGTANTAASDSAAETGPRMVCFDAEALSRLGVKVETAGSSAPSQTLRVPGTLDYNVDHYAEIGALLEGRSPRFSSASAIA